jgi:hypothetical protein
MAPYHCKVDGSKSPKIKLKLLAADTVQFDSIRQSRVTRPLCRDEFLSRSRVTAPSVQCKIHDIRAKSPLEVQKKAQFSKYQNLLVAEVPNRYFESRVTTRAELNEIVQ